MYFVNKNSLIFIFLLRLSYVSCHLQLLYMRCFAGHNFLISVSPSRRGSITLSTESPAPVTQVTGVAAQGGWVKEFLPRTCRGKNQISDLKIHINEGDATWITKAR